MAAPTGRTPNLQLPYPIPDDDVDVPRDIKALADKLDLGYTTVTLLPSSPVAGQLVKLQTAAMLALECAFFLRWDATRSKWIPEGGTPLMKSALTDVPIATDSSPVDGSPVVSLPIPAAGKYWIEFGFGLFIPASSAPQATIAAAPQGLGVPALFAGHAANTQPGTVLHYGLAWAVGAGFARFEPGYAKAWPWDLNAAGNLTLRYSTYNVTPTFRFPWMKATPLVIG